LTPRTPALRERARRQRMSGGRGGGGATVAVPITEAFRMAQAGDLELAEVAYTDPVTKQPTTRWFWNVKGRKGPMKVKVGDLTMAPEEQPFLLAKPSRHKDSKEDATGMGAFTGIPGKANMDAWLGLQEWMVQEVARKGVMRGKPKKGEKLGTPFTVEEVRREMAEWVKPPESEESNHVCISQKLRVGAVGDAAKLNTKFLYVKLEEVEGPDGTTKRRVNEKEPQGLFRAEDMCCSQNFSSIVEFGELKLQMGKYRFMLYARFVLSLVRASGDSTVATFGDEAVDLDKMFAQASALDKGAGGGAGGGVGVGVPDADGDGEDAHFAPYSITDPTGPTDMTLADYQASVTAYMPEAEAAPAAAPSGTKRARAPIPVPDNVV